MRATSRKTALCLALTLAVPAAAFFPLAASGDAAKSGKPVKGADAGGEQAYDPENVIAISQYYETIAKATDRYVAKEYTAAIDLFKKAMVLSPKNPLAPLLLGETYLGASNLGEAEAAFLQAQESADSKNPTLRSHALFAVADIYERQNKREEAKTAWQAYTEHASKFGDAGVYPQTGAERLKVVQKVLDLEKAYVAVRQRIAADKDGGADAAAKK